jgi:hypothetical protein
MNKKQLELAAQITISIPPQPNQSIRENFNEVGSTIFGSVDSNIAAWLPESFDAVDEEVAKVYKLLEPLNNQEVVNVIGGEEEIIQKHLFTPAQIRYLAEQQQKGEIGALLIDGYSNLFFVYNHEKQILYLMGVVWDKSISKWAPYIYRLRNLYRAWSRSNQIFVKKQL